MHRLRKTAILMLALVLVLFQWAALSPHARAKAVDPAVTVSAQTLDGKDVLAMTAVPIKNGDTAFDVLKKAAEQHKLDVRYTEYSFGVTIDQIGTIAPKWDPDHEYWGFFVNGKYSDLGASSYKVKPGDDVLFKVVKDEPEKIPVTVTIKGKDVPAKYVDQTVEVAAGSNVYDAVKLAFGDDVQASIDDQYFAYINNIGGLLKKDQYFWISVNGKDLSSGVSSTPVHAGDKITLEIRDLQGGSGDGANGGGSGGANPPADQGGSNGQPANHSGISAGVLQSAIQRGFDYLLAHEKAGALDFYGAMALAQSGKSVPPSFINRVTADLAANQGVFRNVTDYEKYALAVTAAGYDATNFHGYRLIENIYNNPRLTNQGTNGVIFALLALDSGHYNVPADAKWTRSKLVDTILKAQNADGGWAWAGSQSSVDMTAMAISALAPYKTQSSVQSAITKAVHWLSAKQDENGGFQDAFNGGDTSESTAQVIAALTAAGIDPAGSEFTKAKGNPVSHLLKFQRPDGGFSHVSGDASSPMSTNQAVFGLVSYQRFLKGAGSVFQFTHDAGALKKASGAVHAAPSHKGEGRPLPDTAGSAYDWLVAGACLLALGALILFGVQKRRQSL